MSRLEVTTSDKKYTVIQEDGGRMTFLRHGKPWPEADEQFAFVGLILGLAQEVEMLRGVLKIKEDELTRLGGNVSV